MQRRLLTNCPNCAGELHSDGYCPYCKTKVRYANELDIQAGGLCYGDFVEIAINVKQGDKTIVYPFVGRIRSLEISHVIDSWPSVELIFDGTLKKLENI